MSCPASCIQRQSMCFLGRLTACMADGRKHVTRLPILTPYILMLDAAMHRPMLLQHDHASLVDWASDNALWLNALDSSGVLLQELHWRAEMCKPFHCTGGRSCKGEDQQQRSSGIRVSAEV